MKRQVENDLQIEHARYIKKNITREITEKLKKLTREQKVKKAKKKKKTLISASSFSLKELWLYKT